MKTPISEAEILAARTPKGAWTAKQLATWGVPWPPPGGWKAQLIAHGYPFDPDVPVQSKASIEDAPITAETLQRMMDNSQPDLTDGEPFGVEAELDIDPAKLLRKVVVAVINAGHASDMYEFPDVLAFFGSRKPEASDADLR